MIAAIGILITWSIQRTQIATNESVARAQIDAAKAKAADERKIQEGQITVQLLNHLVSANATQRRLAVVALRQTVPGDVYDAVVQVLAQSDSDPSVRTAAIAQLGTAQSSQAKETLTTIAADKSKPSDERMLAAQSSTQLAITSGTDARTFVYLATTPGQHAMESSKGGGMFTQALIRALQPRPGTRPGTSLALTGKTLAERLNVELATLSEGRQTPTFWTAGNPDTAFSQDQGAPKRALLIGAGDFADPKVTKLRGPEIDAKVARLVAPSQWLPSSTF